MILLAACLLPKASAEDEITEILVTAELIERSAFSIPASISILNQNTIEQRNAQHLDELLNLAPNINFATGASRGRFIQIRGIGERSEFQESIISSVGLIIDGIDMTGLATAATTLDVDQIEVLRGPQGTLYGANGLAGIINIVSNQPTRATEFEVGTAIEEFGGREINAIYNAPINDNGALRAAYKKYRSDGFTDAVFLGRDDTAGFDEESLRVTLRSESEGNTQVGATLFYADIDNGYDAFSLDNTRETFTDNPGEDSQKPFRRLYGALPMGEGYLFETTLSHANSDIVYSYDEDWSNVGICDGTPCDSDLLGFDLFYVSFDSYTRDNTNTALDLRLISSNDSDDGVAWVAGAYVRDQSVDLFREYTFSETDFRSHQDTTNYALYGQIDYSINESWSLTTGLRLEHRDLDYQDNSGGNAAPDESFWGGRLALQYQPSDRYYFYALASRGYKAGFQISRKI